MIENMSGPYILVNKAASMRALKENMIFRLSDKPMLNQTLILFEFMKKNTICTIFFLDQHQSALQSEGKMHISVCISSKEFLFKKKKK